MANKRDRSQYEKLNVAIDKPYAALEKNAPIERANGHQNDFAATTNMKRRKKKKAPAVEAHLSPSNIPEHESSSVSPRASDPRISPAPEGIYSASSTTPLPPALKKYFGQRYTLFSNFDSNVWLTHNSWFEVTPECISNYLAEQILGSSYEDESVEPTKVVLDAFCGIGGNTLAFAAHPACKHVVAVDKDPVALKCLEHNARVFGLRDKITIVEGDFFELAEGTMVPKPTGFTAGPFDAVFVSPPWGGPSYQESGDANGGIFDLETMEPYPFSACYDAAKKCSEKAAFFLPRTSDLRQLAEHAEGKKVRAVHCCVRAASKAICAFYGEMGEGTDVTNARNLGKDARR